MPEIKVSVGQQQNAIRVSVGQQQDAIKIIASGKGSSGNLAQIATDIDATARANNTVLIYNSATQTYIHVPASQIVDLADNVDNDSYDAGTF